MKKEWEVTKKDGPYIGFFSSGDKTTQPRQLIEGRVCLGLCFQRDKSLSASQQGSVQQTNKQLEQQDESSHNKLKAGRRESELGLASSF